MSDIVERLRSDSQRHDLKPDGRDYTYTATPSALEIEAAAEIERLRAALKKIYITSDEGRYGCSEVMRSIALDAIDGKPIDD